MERNKPLTIIIADDDQDDKELLRFLFNANERFELIGCFDSGVDAIEEIITKKNIPDVLLVDMYMPFLTGVEVAMKIQESGTARGMNTFIISGTINSTEQDKHVANPSINFLKKPVTLVDINDLPGLILESLNLNNHMKV